MNRTKQRVLLGMSGGVDSSVAGYLLREQGYEVIGVTMKVWPQDCISRAEDKCCGPQAIADARAVAHSLGIPHYVVDEADQFERLVIDYFSSEYQAGRTPNPCVMCNEKLKFGNLWSKAAALGCHRIATGHYAIIEHHADHAILRKGLDARKDQSYFLFSLRQPQLRRALTPLGKMTKPQIREIAHSLGLKVADKVDSQEICFVPGNDYKAFLRSHLGESEFHPGEIYDVAGNFLGEHDGIELFTIGQRRGLPGGSPQPRYVVDLDPATNRVIVGDIDDLVTEEFEIDRVNWHPTAGIDGDRRYNELKCTVKIRYSHSGTRATLTQLEDGRVHVRLHDPQRAVTPGQAAVFYNGDIVLGGGWICRSEPPRHTEPIGGEILNQSATPAMADQILLAISTFPDVETANRVAEELVTGRFAACANLLPAVRSIYRWKEKIETAGEVMVFFKTTQDRQTAFEEKLRSLHPYEVPELICIKIDSGSPDYLRWVIDNCR